MVEWSAGPDRGSGRRGGVTGVPRSWCRQHADARGDAARGREGLPAVRAVPGDHSDLPAPRVTSSAGRGTSSPSTPPICAASAVRTSASAGPGPTMRAVPRGGRPGERVPAVERPADLAARRDRGVARGRGQHRVPGRGRIRPLQLVSDEDLCVDELISGSEQTARALWATVGSGSSIARTVHAYLPPGDPIHYMIETEAAKTAEQQRWMLRLLDAPAAIAGRGFAASAVLEVDVRIDDPDVPENSGDWRLSVADGLGQLTPVHRRRRCHPARAARAGCSVRRYVAQRARASRIGSGVDHQRRRRRCGVRGSASYMLDYF